MPVNLATPFGKTMLLNPEPETRKPEALKTLLRPSSSPGGQRRERRARIRGLGLRYMHMLLLLPHDYCSTAALPARN